MDPKPPIPGFTEIDEWPIAPVPPISIADFSCYHDPRPYPTVFADLIDSVGHKYQVFFERFLWRLCFGASHDEEADAAYVRVGSSLERRILEILDAAIASDEKYAMLAEPVKHAKHWSPNYK